MSDEEPEIIPPPDGPKPRAGNPNGNPLIVQYGEKTRYSKENQPTHDRKKAHSIRRALKQVARGEVNMDEDGKLEPLSNKKIASFFGVNHSRLSMAQLVAARKFKDALAGNNKAQQQLEDSLDVTIDEDDLGDVRTVGDAVDLILAASAAKA